MRPLFKHNPVNKNQHCGHNWVYYKLFPLNADEPESRYFLKECQVGAKIFEYKLVSMVWKSLCFRSVVPQLSAFLLWRVIQYFITLEGTFKSMLAAN